MGVGVTGFLAVLPPHFLLPTSDSRPRAHYVSTPRIIEFSCSARPGGTGVASASGEPSYKDWMRQEMRRREWRQADFARAVGVDVSMVSRWLQGRRPDPASLERVAAGLGIDLDALLTLAGH